MTAATLPLPPPALRFMGEDDEGFRAVGDQIVSDLREFCRLTASSTVLDVGSGYGRVAHALWRDGWRGDYLGLEILPSQVQWCQDVLTPLSEDRLHFRHMDVRNARYNPKGTIEPTSVRFGEMVDIVVLTSVFTHMYPDEVRHYLGEIARSLAGRALVTFFCLDDDWKVRLAHELEPGCRFQSPDDPLHRIGYTPRWIYQAAADAGLRVYAMSLGKWCGRPAGRGYQDTFILEAI